MEASNISWIVYELVRLKDDRASMAHEDVVSRSVEKITELRSRNKKLSSQLKDLYRKYEKAMLGEEFPDARGTNLSKKGASTSSEQIDTSSGQEPKIGQTSPSKCQPSFPSTKCIAQEGSQLSTCLNLCNPLHC